MNPRIVVTATGTLTPLGGTQETADAVFAGRSAITPLPEEFSLCPTQIGGIIPDLDLGLWFEARAARRIASRSARTSQFSHVVIRQALSSAGLLDEDNRIPAELRQHIGISVGTGIGTSELIAKVALGMEWVAQAADEEEQQNRMQKFVREHLATAMTVLPDASAFQPTMTFGTQGPTDCSIKACATGAGNIRRAAMEILLGHADIMVAGGVESLAITDVIVLGVYARNGALSRRNDDPEGASRPFDQDHDGFVPAEGAGVVVLESLESAERRGACILAELRGFGETTDAKDPTDPDTDSQVRAMRIALEAAGMQPDEIQLMKAHGTSTIAGDASELEALKEVFGANRSFAITAPKSILGHTLGASGALEAAIAIEGMRRGLVPPTINLETPIPEMVICAKAHEHEEECFLNIPRTATEAEITGLLCNSFGFGGQNVCLVLARWQG